MIGKFFMLLVLAGVDSLVDRFDENQISCKIIQLIN